MPYLTMPYLTMPYLTMAAGSFLDVTAEELVAVCADIEPLQGLGLRLSGEHHLDRGRLAELAAAVAASGLRIFDVEVHRIGSPVGPHIASAEGLIEAAASVGAQHVLVVADVAERQLMERELARIVDMAAEHGLGVGLEYMAWTMPNSVDAARSLADATGCRLVVDVLHHTRLGATVEDLGRIVREDQLGWVQICDAGPPPDPTTKDHLLFEARHRRLPPGTGILPLDTLLAALPPTTVFSIEVQSDELSTIDPRERAELLTTASRGLLRRIFSR